jgi:hypothetical protein
MGWHDCPVHAVTATDEANEFVMDIDYILAWVEPKPPSAHFSFWISPATLVFSDVWELDIRFENKKNIKEPTLFDILDLEHDSSKRAWTFKLSQGEISFVASGFTQYIRRPPRHVQAQWFSVKERGGISFERTSGAW